MSLSWRNPSSLESAATLLNIHRVVNAKFVSRNKSWSDMTIGTSVTLTINGVDDLQIFFSSGSLRVRSGSSTSKIRGAKLVRE
jgi:hypothetical protein